LTIVWNIGYQLLCTETLPVWLNKYFIR